MVRSSKTGGGGEKVKRRSLLTRVQSWTRLAEVDSLIQEHRESHYLSSGYLSASASTGWPVCSCAESWPFSYGQDMETIGGSTLRCDAQWNEQNSTVYPTQESIFEMEKWMQISKIWKISEWSREQRTINLNTRNDNFMSH